MNILLPFPDVRAAAEEFVRLDPKRANAQIKECCQLLAAVDNVVLGRTSMIKKDGTPYGTSHPHHPITKHMMVSGKQYRLVRDLALELSRCLSEHACAKSFNNWACDHILYTGSDDYVLCRKDRPHIFVKTLEEYSKLSREYLVQTKAYPCVTSSLSSSPSP